ncbi:MAG: hypothetical protein M3Z27_10415, partial [Actinomycetota bacterium]|nr:hypothetical protein [Actinomycetota bacterium]
FGACRAGVRRRAGFGGSPSTPAELDRWVLSGRGCDLVQRHMVVVAEAGDLLALEGLRNAMSHAAMRFRMVA